MMFALLDTSVSTITKPICEERSLLLAKEASVNASSCRELTSSLTYVRPRSGLSFCHLIRLLRAVTSLFKGVVTWAAKDKSKDASGWHIDAIYAPLARCATYCSLVVRAWRTLPLELVVVAGLLSMRLRFLHWSSCISLILLLSDS